ncbi:MAG: hypothetical protein H6509_00040 [Bryobacterales bacterium]|nr:hypothetical protein [Bryobacterales bacterium]
MAESRRQTTALLGAACLALAIAPYAYGVLHSPGFGYLGDQPVHLELSRAFARAMSEGEIPPSWAASLSGGRGGPAFVLYPPLFFALTWLCSFLARDMTAALGLAVVVSAAWLFVATYYLARAELSPRRSLLAATLVPLLPGVVLIGWGRGLLPNLLALGWTAFLLGAALRTMLAPGRWRNRIALFAACCGLVLTHALSSVMAVVIALLCLPSLARVAGRKGLTAVTGAALAASAATAWFWVPLVRASRLAQTHYLAQVHPYEQSLWLGPPSAADAYSQTWKGLNEFGLIVAGLQLALAAAVVLAGYKQEKTHLGLCLPWVAGFVALASVYPVGAWLARAPGLGLVQFSWRWQGPLAIVCAVALAGLPRKRIVGPAVFGILLALGFTPFFRGSDALPADVAGLSPEPLTEQQYAEIGPRERALYTGNLIEMRPLEAPTLRYPPAAPGAVEVAEGEAEVEAIRVEEADRSYRVRANSPITLRLATFAFPGWTALWRGAPVAIRTEEATGLQLVDLPAGEGELRLEFSRWTLFGALR